jgi:hypothetical protein
LSEVPHKLLFHETDILFEKNPNFDFIFFVSIQRESSFSPGGDGKNSK